MRVSAALLVVSLTCALLAAPVATAAAPGSSVGVDDSSVVENQQTLQVEDDNQTVRQTLRVQMTGDGHAEWTVTTRYELDDEDDREAFEQLVADLQSGDADDVGYSAETFREYASSASTATDREMEITDEEWSGTVEDDTGVLVLSFTWTNFAAVDGDRIELGDVFQTADGDTWLPNLNADQRLVIVAPDGYAVDGFSLDTPPDSGFEDRTAQWTGPVTFDANDIRITYVDTDTQVPDEGISAIVLMIGGIGVVVLVTLVALLVRSDRHERVEELLPGAIAGIAADTGSSEPEPDETTHQTEAGSGDEPTQAAEAAGAGAAPSDGDDDVDPELLSDEERVLRLIERNGGRMKQANIVTETGWSNAKVSQLLSAMDEEDRINKLRIGRENLISLPDEDVAETDP